MGISNPYSPQNLLHLQFAPQTTVGLICSNALISSLSARTCVVWRWIFSPRLIRLASEIWNPEWEQLDVWVSAWTLVEILKVKQASCLLNFYNAHWLYLFAHTGLKTLPLWRRSHEPCLPLEKEEAQRREGTCQRSLSSPETDTPRPFCLCSRFCSWQLRLLLLDSGRCLRQPSLASMCSEAYLNGKPRCKSL